MSERERCFGSDADGNTHGESTRDGEMSCSRPSVRNKPAIDAKLVRPHQQAGERAATRRSIKHGQVGAWVESVASLMKNGNCF